MARPSLKAEKTQHILQAYERCIALYGVEGATLQKVAEEADMARPLLRHYVGNQEDLLEQSIARYFERQKVNMAGFHDIDSVDALLDSLFDKDYLTQPKAGDANDIMIASAFTLAAQKHPTIKNEMQAWFSQLKHDFETLLTQLFPDVDKQKVTVVETGLIGIYFNLYAMHPVDSSQPFFEQSLAAAKVLLTSLGHSFD